MCTSRSTLTVSLHYYADLISPLTPKAIVAIFKKYPKVAISLIIEPDSLPNLVTNSNVQACQAAASGYRDGVAYALKQLNLPNVAMYLDAGHGGWLGWPDNLRTSSSSPHTPHSPFPPLTPPQNPALKSSPTPTSPPASPSPSAASRPTSPAGTPGT